jgi:addiction module antidote protein HigA
MNGLSLEFIVHPGETLKEVLEDRNMLQEELAERTGFSPKHISEVVNGKKGISPKLAKSLEYVFRIPATFWINLQGIYDKEIIEFEEKNNISKSEFEIAKEIRPVLEYAVKLKLIDKINNDVESVLISRNICGVQNLAYMEKILSSQVAYRTASKQKVNQYTLYVWQRVCELLASKENNINIYNKQLLSNNLENIKKLMFEENPNNMIKKLKDIFNECGITFELVKHFTGAPVQGFIEKKENRMILCMTIRQSYADIFWFTLFHEIGHILNGDIEYNRINYYIENEERENDADIFAKNILIYEDAYKDFINKADFSKESIIKFSKKQKVQPFIVVGRLQKDKKIKYSQYNDLKIRYKYK